MTNQVFEFIKNIFMKQTIKLNNINNFGSVNHMKIHLQQTCILQMHYTVNKFNEQYATDV